MYESLLVITVYLVGIFSPLLIPVVVHAIYFAREGDRVRPLPSFRRLRVPLLLPASRVAAPAMA